MKTHRMQSTDSRIDDYIKRAQPFAQPILLKMRFMIHKACPQITETLKWGMPSFEYKGPLFSMAAFKNHCVGGFWKASLLNDPKGVLGKIKSEGGEAMGNFGRMTSVADLPSEKYFSMLVKQHIKLNEEGIKPAKKVKPAAELLIPDDFINALKTNKQAEKYFVTLSPSHKREYIEWIIEAKTQSTRVKRISKTIDFCAEGKSKNWKYRPEG